MDRVPGHRSWPWLVWLVLALVMCSCAHPPLKEARQALRLTSAPDLSDDLDINTLIDAVNTEIAFLEKAPNHQTMQFGEKSYSKADYLAGLRHFVDLAKSLPSREELFKAIERDFDFYEVYGDKSWGEVFITSYFEPVVPGSLRRTAKFTQPLYAQPGDLLALDLTLFDPKYAGDRKLRGRVAEQKILPYFTREEIDSKGALKGRRLELAWVDPIDAFMIQIQGSATIDLGRGRQLRVGYAEKNGQPYEPLGKFVRDAIPKEQLTLQGIENYLHTLPPERVQQLLNMNPSYVFFKKPDGPGLTSLGVPPTGGRTIAVDQRYFPKGALCFLSTTKPKWAPTDTLVPKEWEKLERFVLDQDIGGAITGGGRLDLFWGSGPEAKRNAGVMKQTGKLYYLAPKEPKPK